MGWSYRKSFGLSPVRINFSKKGVSYSIGLKGARVNIGSSGTYVSLSTHGISYRQRISAPSSPSNQIIHRASVAEQGNITSADINQLTDTDSKAFITELNQKVKKISYTRSFGTIPLLVIICLLLCNSFGKQQTVIKPAKDNVVVRINTNDVNVRQQPDKKSVILKTVSFYDTFPLLDSIDEQWLKIGIADSVGYISRKLVNIDHIIQNQVNGEVWINTNPYWLWELVFILTSFVILIIRLKKVDKKRFEMELHYDMDENYRQVYEQFKHYFSAFSKSAKIWQYLNVAHTNDLKRNAGAGKLIKRIAVHGVSQNKVPIPYFITNVAIPCISLRNLELFFLPERLLIKRGNTFAAVFYKNLHINSMVTRFIESEWLPHDADVVDYTWRYVNKNGGPDRRFNNNRQFPVCAYSEYTFTSDTGIFEVITTSKRSAMDDFVAFLSKIGALQSRYHEYSN